jgi:hypothetical protein
VHTSAQAAGACFAPVQQAAPPKRAGPSVSSAWNAPRGLAVCLLHAAAAVCRQTLVCSGTHTSSSPIEQKTFRQLIVSEHWCMCIAAAVGKSLVDALYGSLRVARDQIAFEHVTCPFWVFCKSCTVGLYAGIGPAHLLHCVFTDKQGHSATPQPLAAEGTQRLPRIYSAVTGPTQCYSVRRLAASACQASSKALHQPSCANSLYVHRLVPQVKDTLVYAVRRGLPRPETC